MAINTQYGFLFIGGLILVLFALRRYRHLLPYWSLQDLISPPPSLTKKEQEIIQNLVLPYSHFSESQKELFLKRLSWLKIRKKFVFNGEVGDTEEIGLFICAALSLLSMGMDKFRFTRSIRRIIVYPSRYYSKINRKHHLGEYNPAHKILVFAADSLKEGFKIPNDNTNLALHEVAHALCFETHNKDSWEARRFQYGLRKLKEYLANPKLKAQLEEEAHFRQYAFENHYEFFAVLTENFIEGADVFHNKYPELYDVIRRMYNFDFDRPGWKLKLRS